MAWKGNSGDLHIADPYMVKVMILFNVSLYTMHGTENHCIPGGGWLLF